MKKVIATSFVYFLLLFPLCLQTFAQLPFSDGFESGGFTNGGWVVSGSTQISSQSPSQGNYCSEGPSTWGLLKNFPSITDNFITVIFDVKASQTNTTSLIFRIKDAIGNTSAGIIVNDLGQVVGVDGGGGNLINLLAYNTSTWYAVRMEMDMINKKYDIYIDNQLLGNDFNFFSTGFTMPYDFSWSSLAASGSAWLDGIEIYGGTSGIQNNYSVTGSLNVFPNPVIELLNVDLPMQENYTWRLFNTAGKKVKEGNFIGKKNLLSMSGLNNGFYFLELTGENKQLVFHTKIEKR